MYVSVKYVGTAVRLSKGGDASPDYWLSAKMPGQSSSSLLKKLILKQVVVVVVVVIVD
jgi:hypothetical protein